MQTRSRPWLRAVSVAVALALAGTASAAIKVRKPVLEKPATGKTPVRVRRPETPGDAYFVGSVIFARGGQVVAEIDGGALERERMILFDAGLRRRGKAVVVKILGKGVYLLQPTGATTAGPGDHLARESETEAAARVIRTNRIPSYREFLDLFPKNEHRPRISREMFRLAMKGRYPTFPGSVVEGRLRLAETTGREVPLNQVAIKLDRFVIARTDEKGRFRVEGVPRIEEPVTVQLTVRDPRFQVAEEIPIVLGADKFEEITLDVPVQVTPTVLSGQVVDERGAGLPGAEVWTHPYSMEVLTDDTGAFRISRRKNASTAGGDPGVDEPLFGGDFEVFAYRRGYAVERATVTAESFQENGVSPIRLARQDLAGETVPALDVDLQQFLQIAPQGVSPEASGPRLNR